MSSSSRWSDLPPELLATISTTLKTTTDYIRLRSVCSSWRSSITPTPLHLPLQPPLLFPSSSLPLPQLHSHHHLLLLGSSDGLLILRSPSTSSISLLNPLTLTLTLLPSVKTFPNSSFFIKKIVLSPPPSSAAIALLAWSNNLALSRSGDLSWNLIQGSAIYSDAVFFRDRFFVVDGYRRVFSVENDGNNLKQVVRLRVSRSPPFIRRGEKCYLVDFRGDLLLVIRILNCVQMEGERESVVTKGFEVFRLELRGLDGESGSVEVKSLGDGVLFLGLNRSIALLVDEYPGFRGNCIYFLDDTLNCNGDLATQSNCGGGGDAGVFDMGDGSIEPLECYAGGGGDSSLVGGRHPVVWFTPSLC